MSSPRSTLLRKTSQSYVNLLKDKRGTAVIEMALVLPLFVMFVMGIITYGDWFFNAHNVQQAANDAARASVAGLDAGERATIAQSAMQTSLRRAGTLDTTKMSMAIDDDGTTLVVRLSYDASADPLFALKILPLPGATIQRSAAIHIDKI